LILLGFLGAKMVAMVMAAAGINVAMTMNMPMYNQSFSMTTPVDLRELGKPKRSQESALFQARL
jgi:hypothetical protein